MLTVCWAAKGGSGTTVTAVAMAIAQTTPTVVVDLAGDVPLVAGVHADRPGIFDWLASAAEPDRLARLEIEISAGLTMVPAGRRHPDVDAPAPRWQYLADHLAADRRHVIVDAGTGEPPPALVERAGAALLVTRACYVSITRSCALTARPSGIVLLAEPGRVLQHDDVERAIGAPIVATVQLDPRIARAVDAGLATSRLPRACLDRLRSVA